MSTGRPIPGGRHVVVPGGVASGAVRTTALVLVAFAAALVAYGAWKLGHFGALAPTPFVSKGAGGGLPLAEWRTNFRHYFEAQNGRYSPFGFYYVWFALLGVGGLWTAWALRAARMAADAWTLGLAVALAVVYASFTDWMPGMRYFAPLLPLLALSSRDLFGPAPGRASARSGIVLLALALATNLFATTQVRLDAESLGRSTRESVVELGRWLDAAVPDSTLLAVSDVGAVPYYSGLPTLDINPESLTDLRIAREGWSSDYVLGREPGVIVLVSFSRDEPAFSPAHAELAADSRFERYRRAGVVRYAWRGDRSYWVYVREDVPVEPGALAELPEGLGSMTPGEAFPEKRDAPHR